MKITERLFLKQFMRLQTWEVVRRMISVLSLEPGACEMIAPMAAGVCVSCSRALPLAKRRTAGCKCSHAALHQLLEFLRLKQHQRPMVNPGIATHRPT